MQAEPSSYPTFVSVIGQTNLFEKNSTVPPTASSLSEPEGMSVDPATGKLFIADAGNSRLLRFASEISYQNGGSAEAVLGQSSFITFAPGLGPAGMDHPKGVFLDSSGRLWIADTRNRRILRFDNAATISSGANADAVIGQASFATNASSGAGPHSGFEEPVGIFGDDNDHLWVADYMLHRILRFDNAPALSGVVAANAVLGQPDFSEFTPGLSAKKLDGPWGIWLDKNGSLWVAEEGNDRVLKYSNAANKTTNGSADVVVGQPDFTTNGFREDEKGFDDPYYAAVSPNGTLWVGDSGNSRFLGFRNALNFGSFPTSDLLVGQPDYITINGYPATNRNIRVPNSIEFGESGSIFFCAFGEHRIVRYSDPVEIIAPKKKVARNSKITIKGSAKGAELVQYRIAGRRGFKSVKGTPAKWKVNATGVHRRVTRLDFRAFAFDLRSGAAKTKIILKK
jgi:sugar lactone lactonase YvrE